VAIENINRLTSNTPDEIEKMLYGKGINDASNKIQTSHFSNSRWMSLYVVAENPGMLLNINCANPEKFPSASSHAK
jgi:hypothetical protein